MRTPRQGFADESGSAVVMGAIALTVIFAGMALAVDVGMLYSARGQAQRAADAAALAGASAFVDGGSTEQARARAVDYATRNVIQQDPVRPDEVTVTPDPARSRVTVVIRRRGMGAMFARLIGIGSLDVAARATARATPAGNSLCVKPFSPADPLEVTGPGGGGAGGAGGGGGGGGRSATGFEVGQAISLWGGPGGAVFWDMPATADWTGTCSAPGIGGGGSGPQIRRNICMCTTTPVRVGQAVDELNGNHTGPIRQGIDGLVEQDPSAYWHESLKRVVNSRFGDWRQSPRVATLALHDPGDGFKVTRFIRVFLEESGSGSLTGRYVQSVSAVQLVE